MTGGEFIALARKLLTVPAARCPAGYRSITSRLYYGAYHEALALIEDELGFRHRKMDDNANKHQFVVEYLSGCVVEEAEDLAAQIAQLHERRKSADYDLSQTRFDDESLAIESVARIDRIIRALDVCREDEVRSRIQRGMSEYRQRRSFRP